MLPRYKEIIDLMKKGSTLEAQEQILCLREAALELQEENQELKLKVKDLEAALNLKEEVVWVKPYYFKLVNDERDGPYCQRCYDVDSKLIRLQGGHNDAWHCAECKKSYYGEAYIVPKTRPRKSRVIGGF